MKTLLLLLLTTATFGQGLDKYGQHIKDNAPNTYEIIKQHAVDKWGDDFTMTLHEINRQSKAFYELMHSFKKENATILAKAIDKWGYDGYKDSNMAIMKGEGEIYSLHVDWCMCQYEYDKQVEAKNSF